MNSENAGYRKADELISSLFEGVNQNEMKEAVALVKGWKSIVSTISTSKTEKNKTGMLLASHSDVVDMKNEVLLIETDHPMYIQLFQIYKTYILRGLKMKFPQISIKNIVYRLKNTDIKLRDVEDEYEKRERKNTREEDDSSDFEVNKNLPPELRKQFEQIKAGILTNGQEKC